MPGSTDPYPSRTEQALDIIARRDPVVYSPTGKQCGPLNPAQLDEYQRNGFLFCPNFFSAREMRQFLDDLRAYDEDSDLKSQQHVIIEPHADEIRSIFAVHRLSDRANRLTRDSRLLDIAHQLLGSEVYIHQSRINYKPGFTGNGFNWHSDFETWHSEDGMPRMRCFSVSILLLENNPYNGPLMLIPGSHMWFIPTRGRTPQENWRQSLRNQTLGVPEREQLQRMAGKDRLSVPTGAAGSLILFECNTLHASANNYSPWPRSNLFFVYNSIENALVQPFCGNRPRPEFIATRENVRPLRGLSSAA